MNLVLFSESEISNGSITLSDRRSEHIANVLNPKPGDRIRIGIIGGMAGTAVFDGEENGIVRLVDPVFDVTPPLPWFDIMLAVPRPKVLHRLWAPLASLGARRIVLVNAAKVEKYYFDTHWLSPETYIPLLMEGLEQASTTAMPEVVIKRSFRKFVEDDVPREWPDSPKFVAHPRISGKSAITTGYSQPEPDAPLPLVAIGPEGGWTDFELELLFKAGFAPLSLGVRALRTDIACAAIAGALAGAEVFEGRAVFG